MASLQEIKQLLDKSSNPLVFYDDDPDGLCSFLLVMGYLKRGNGVILKNSPTLDANYITIVRQYAPDLVVVLDKPMISQEFLEGMHVPVVWIDHHPIVDVQGVRYFNPRFADAKDNRPTTYWCYEMVGGKPWVALMGIVSDWSLASFAELSRHYPRLVDGKKFQHPDEAYGTALGKLIRVCSFALKGKTKDVYAFIQLMMQVQHPEEILEQRTAAGKNIYARFEKINTIYEELLEKALALQKEKILVFTYVNDRYSFTSDLANELLSRTKARFIFVGREDKGEMKASLRTREGGVVLPLLVQKALEGLNGYGGGHDHASGCCVKMEDFNEFIERLKKVV